MSITRVVDAHEQRPCAYVYLLLCRDADAIHIKIGQTADPWKRFSSLRTMCPIAPRSMSMLPLPSREMAITIERALHASMAKWRSEGEWFRMTAADKQEFNDRLQGVILMNVPRWWKLGMQKLSADALKKLAASRKRAGWAALRNAKIKYGKAFADFAKHSHADPLAEVSQAR